MVHFLIDGIVCNNSSWYRCRWFSIIHYDDPVGVFDRVDPLRNNDRRRSRNFSFQAFADTRSVLVSTALVESSRIKIFGFFSRREQSSTVVFTYRKHCFLLAKSVFQHLSPGNSWIKDRLVRRCHALDLFIRCLFIAPTQIVVIVPLKSTLFCKTILGPAMLLNHSREHHDRRRWHAFNHII